MTIYEYDGTGDLAENRVINEYHVTTPDNADAYYTLSPKYAPMFESDIAVEALDEDSDEYVTVDPGVGWWPTFRYVSISNLLRKPVFGRIAIARSTGNNIRISYTTLGGKTIFDSAETTAVVSALMKMTRQAVWDNVVDRLEIWYPTHHDTDANDIGGYGDLVASVNNLAESMPSGQNAALLRHMVNSDAHGLRDTIESINANANAMGRRIDALERSILDNHQ